MSKISLAYLYWLWRYSRFCGCVDRSGLKFHTSKWTIPKMDFFGGLMTKKIFEDLVLHG